MVSLFKFILNAPNLEGTVIERYIDLAVKEKAPEIYKPREGRVNSNLEKFNREQLDFMFSYAKEMLTNFGYEQTYIKNGDPVLSKYIEEYNKTSL